MLRKSVKKILTLLGFRTQFNLGLAVSVFFSPMDLNVLVKIKFSSEKLCVGLNTEWAEFTASSAGGQFQRQRCFVLVVSHARNILLWHANTKLNPKNDWGKKKEIDCVRENQGFRYPHKKGL